MSHFTVLVIGEDPKGQLEPYWELDLPKEKIMFDKRAVFNKKFKAEDLEKEFEKFKKENKKDIEKGEQEYWVKYKTCSAKEWLKDWSGNYLNKEKTHYGYYHNPNAQWDWYSLGGRWTGAFKLKEEFRNEGKLGEPGIQTELPEMMTCDQAKKGHIDFSLDEKAYKEAIRFWEIVVEDSPLKKGEEEPFNMYKKEYYFENYKDKEFYARNCATIGSYAVIKDGEWYSKGKMGWFGLSSHEGKESYDWDENYYDKWIKELPDDTLLSLYDCHI